MEQLVESNKLTKKDFNIDRDSIPLDEQREIFNELVREISPEFKHLEKRINPDSLIYKYNNEQISPTDFRNY